MTYNILEGPFYTLIAKVNEYIKKGWKPQGGVLTAHEGQFYQAMVKE